jgi:NSS family neurotransmitter:Na+ symporter
LVVAALTSSISLLEVVVAAFSEELKMSRKTATLLATVTIAILGILATLSFGKLKDVKLFDFTIFEFLDNFSSNVLLPLGGFFIVIFVGWVLSKKDVKDELTNQGKYRIGYLQFYRVLVRYLVPTAIAFVFLNRIGVF